MKEYAHRYEQNTTSGNRYLHGECQAPPRSKDSEPARIVAELQHLALTNSAEVDKQIEHTPEAFLQAMRLHIKARTSKNLTSTSTVYDAMHNQLLRIHQAVSSHRRDNYITSIDIERLGYNANRFHKTLQAPPFAFSFLERFYHIYADDVDFFHAHGYSPPGHVALLHSREIVDEVTKRRIAHPFINNSDFSRIFRRSPRNPIVKMDDWIARVEELRDHTEPRLRKEYGYEEESWDQSVICRLATAMDPETKARELLSLTKRLHEKYPFAPINKLEEWATVYITRTGNAKTLAPKVNKLLAHMPPNLTYNELNLLAAAEGLHRLRRARREGALRQEGRLLKARVFLSPEALQLAHDAKHNWHEVFEGIDLIYEASALWTDVALYNQMVAAHQPNLAIGTDIQNLYHMLIAFGRDVAILNQRGKTNATIQARVYGTEFYGHFSDFEKDIKDQYPWMSASLIRMAFVRADSKNLLAHWDTTFKDLSRLYPNHPDLPSYRCSVLATHEGTPTEIAQAYLARVEEIMSTYGPEAYVKREYAQRWAEDKEHYLAKAKEHITRSQEIDIILQQFELFNVPPLILGRLAFLDSKPADIKRFIAARKSLEIFRDEPCHNLPGYMPQWMIDHIATFGSSQKDMQQKLLLLAHLKQTNRHLGHLLPGLALLDQKATLTVFGFTQDISKAQLEEELDVPNLDEYVLNEILPTRLK